MGCGASNENVQGSKPIPKSHVVRVGGGEKLNDDEDADSTDYKMFNTDKGRPSTGTNQASSRSLTTNSKTFKPSMATALQMQQQAQQKPGFQQVNLKYSDDYRQEPLQPIPQNQSRQTLNLKNGENRPVSPPKRLNLDEIISTRGNEGGRSAREMRAKPTSGFNQNLSKPNAQNIQDNGLYILTSIFKISHYFQGL